MLTSKRAILKAAKTFALVAFGLALLGIFVVGNYLMTGGHRPYGRVVASGFDIPIPAKGGIIYVSASDLAVLVGMIVIVAVSMIGANRIDKALR